MAQNTTAHHTPGTTAARPHRPLLDAASKLDRSRSVVDSTDVRALSHGGHHRRP
ncbi:hypothetical protein [Streptomyces sp. NPDC051636]|uniref:hypothetical protein n=1 Tax=Streptomyces sp. NPDC051636 TaxID=3365663 RepID=UPI00378D6A07